MDDKSDIKKILDNLPRKKNRFKSYKIFALVVFLISILFLAIYTMPEINSINGGYEF